VTHVAADAALARAEAVPGAHMEHAAEPADAQVPAGHGWHELEPEGAAVPAGHVVQTASVALVQALET
jgi:hypothetical protein